ncbi:glutamate--cysteine ligase, partial [Striga asiatica]
MSFCQENAPFGKYQSIKKKCRYGREVSISQENADPSLYIPHDTSLCMLMMPSSTTSALRVGFGSSVDGEDANSRPSPSNKFFASEMRAAEPGSESETACKPLTSSWASTFFRLKGAQGRSGGCSIRFEGGVTSSRLSSFKLLAGKPTAGNGTH